MTRNILTLALAAALAIAGCTPKTATLTKSGLDPKDFEAERNGKKTALYTLTNEAGMEVCITNFGGRLVSVMVPDRDGEFKDVILGFDNVKDYFPENNQTDFGASIGRYANRIKDGRFTLDGVEYQLPQNNYGHCLHGGPEGWQYQVYDVLEADSSHLKLEMVSPDGDSGFPGKVTAHVTFTLTEDNKIDIRYDAVTDAPTIINMTNHAYFNLNGHDSGSAMGHLLRIDSDRRLVSDETVLPTGAIADVAGTAWDFRELRPIERAMPSAGFDTCFVLNGDGVLAHAARLVGEKSGIAMDLLCDQPGMQLYTANFMSDPRGKHGTGCQPRSAVCLEPGIYPDAIHHPAWPSPVFSPERPYLWRMRLEFSLV